MRIHAIVDDEIFRAAQAACPDAPTKRALLENALRALVEQRAAKDLAKMVQGFEFAIEPVPRRRSSGDDGKQ